MAAAVLPGKDRLFIAPHRSYHLGAEMRSPLAGNQPHAARCRVKEYPVARLYRDGCTQQITRGHAFKHHCRGNGKVDGFRKLDEPLGGKCTQFRIGAEGPVA